MSKMTPRDHFQIAYRYLRQGLAAGAFVLDERIGIALVAEQLGVSQTPVREALSRLVGEGLLLDRRGQGYYPAPLDADAIAGLIRLRALYLAAAISSRGSSAVQARALEILGEAEMSSADRIDALFAVLLSATDNASLVAADRRASARLAAARRAEARIFDIATEVEILAEALRSNDRGELRRRVQSYFKTRERKSGPWSLAIRANIESI